MQKTIHGCIRRSPNIFHELQIVSEQVVVDETKSTDSVEDIVEVDIDQDTYTSNETISTDSDMDRAETVAEASKMDEITLLKNSVKKYNRVL